MQIGIRLHDTLPMALPERLAHTREQGFSCAHVALSKVIDDFEIKNSTLTPGFAMYLKKLFARNDQMCIRDRISPGLRIFLRRRPFSS